MSSLLLVATIAIVLALSSSSTAVEAFAAGPPLLLATPPILGIGAVLFKPRNKILKSEGDNDKLDEAGRFFVEAFWTGKIGGASTLSQSQSSSLERQQIAEFKKRYNAKRSTASYAAASKAGGSNRLPGNYAAMASAAMDSRSELVLCVDGKGECIGCAGVEVDKIKKMDGNDSTTTGPIMSNLAISRDYRRKGLAEDLVKSAELIARKEWGYDDCYLYVEKRNVPAIKLYTKLGYKTIWEDDDATTLLPTEDGRSVKNGKTTIVCMKKKLGGGLFGSLFG